MAALAKRKPKVVQASFRPDPDVVVGMDRWLKKNPGWHKSTLLNQAVREFISHPYTTTPVEMEIEMMGKEEGDEILEKIIRERADTLERLK